MKKFAILASILMIVLWTVSSHAEVTYNDSDPFDMLAFVPCADSGSGETVELTGNIHTLITYTINNNNISWKSHSNPQDVTGIGQTTGDVYKGTGVTQSSGKTSLQNGQAVATFVNNFRIIGKGLAVNYWVHENTTLVFNANGIQSVTHDNLNVECK